MEIDENILEATTKCNKNYDCLKVNNYMSLKSKVEGCSNRKVLFINCNDLNCKYRIGFGESIICNCPIRIEIFNKYKR